MYSNKENVGILTALLVAHGVCHAVVCPGSRNAPIVHNLRVCPHITCYPVTDERSAGFYALGLSLALQAPVAVCVTSGSALLNQAPAASEAFYQHAPVVFISAVAGTGLGELKDLRKLMDPRYIEVKGIFTPRGGIAIHPFANWGDPEHEAMARERLMAEMSAAD